MFAPPLSSVAREPSGGCSPGRYLPVSTPCAIGDHTTWEMPSSRDAGTTSSSITRHSIEYCGWLEISWKPRSSASSCPCPQLINGPLTHADVEHLAGPDQVGEGLHGLLERCLVVIPMGLVDVDVVGLQPPQRAVGGFHDVLARQAQIVVTLRSDRPEDLGHDLQRLSPLALERLAEDGFCPRVGVHIGSVEGADAGIQCCAYAAPGLVVLHLRAVGQPVAVGDFGDLEA